MPLHNVKGIQEIIPSMVKIPLQASVNIHVWLRSCVGDYDCAYGETDNLEGKVNILMRTELAER